MSLTRALTPSSNLASQFTRTQQTKLVSQSMTRALARPGSSTNVAIPLQSKKVLNTPNQRHTSLQLLTSSSSLCTSAQRRHGSHLCHAAGASGQTNDQWEIKMLYDGDCPLCMREVNMLKKRDRDQHKIGFVDISSPEYSPTDNAGISYEEAMGTIHGILPGDKIITNVDVFRKLYEVVGLGWVYAITRYGPINNLANKVYAVWAKYRLPITGRPDIETVLRQKKESCRGTSS